MYANANIDNDCPPLCGNLILEHGEAQTFEPFDRFAQFAASKGKSLADLLEEFATLRRANITALQAMNIQPADFGRKGRHPALGEGTLAPWDETRRLVVRGVYRHVRNPMITGVLCLLLGEASLLGSLPLLGWFALFLLANALYIPLAEERGLERRFGEEYLLYKRNVPRWIPRVRPWNSPPGAGPH